MGAGGSSLENPVDHKRISERLHRVAMFVIEARRRQSQAPATVAKWLKTATNVAQGLCSLLETAPLGASIAAKALGKVFEQLEAALALGPAVSMLVLDVILVYEVLNRLWELRHDSARDSTSHDSNVDQRQQEPEQHQQPQEQQDQEPEQQQAPQEQQREEEHTTPALTPAEEGPKALDWWHVLCCCRSRSSAKVHPAQSAPVPAPTGAAAGSPSGGGGQRGNQADISGAAGSSSAPGDGDAEAALEAASNTLGDFAIAKTAGAIHAALLRLVSQFQPVQPFHSS